MYASQSAGFRTLRLFFHSLGHKLPNHPIAVGVSTLVAAVDERCSSLSRSCKTKQFSTNRNFNFENKGQHTGCRILYFSRFLFLSLKCPQTSLSSFTAPPLHFVTTRTGLPGFLVPKGVSLFLRAARFMCYFPGPRTYIINRPAAEWGAAATILCGNNRFLFDTGGRVSGVSASV